MPHDLFSADGRKNFLAHEPARGQAKLSSGGGYLDLRGADIALPEGMDKNRFDRLAKLVRGLIFSTVEAAKSGHPGGSSSKTEPLLALILGGALAFDPLRPKHPARDRVVWSAGHCTPLHHSLQALIYESLRRSGRKFDPARLDAVMPEHLARFRHIDGPQGHVESHYPLADSCTGASGHGLSAALGLAVSHRGSGLKTNVWAIMGDAETEEGLTFEARNMAVADGVENLIVVLDYNHFGIDGPIEEVIADNYLNHWLGLGWNVIEADGHDIGQLVAACRLAAARHFGNGRPTAIISHGVKGYCYGPMENTAASHGSPAKHEDYVAAVRALGFGIAGETGKAGEDIKFIAEALTAEEATFVAGRLDAVAALVPPEEEAAKSVATALSDRPLADPRSIVRPETLPPELVFPDDKPAATRKATEAWFTWLMKQTAFFYVGAGDLAKSILTSSAEQVYGLVAPKNPFGRGLRFGIAEQNMAMMSTALTQDILPGGYRPVSAFGSYAVFSSMMSNCIRMSLIGNRLNPAAAGFYVLLAAHDGPETGEDGPTHHGLFWMSLFKAYPGIKVYKPFDANETVEMLFHALKKGEPIALSVMRPDTPVLKRGGGVPPAAEAVNGAYVYKPYSGSGKSKLVLAVSGVQTLVNTLAILPQLEAERDIKIVNVTSPELFEELRAADPAKAATIFADEERARTVALHNGWPGFLHEFLLPADHRKRSVGIEDYLRSGNAAEVYAVAGLTPDDILAKIRRAAA